MKTEQEICERMKEIVLALMDISHDDPEFMAKTSCLEGQMMALRWFLEHDET